MINTFVFVSFAGGCWGFISSLDCLGFFFYLLSSYCFRVSTKISKFPSTCMASISVAQATQQLDTYFRPGTATAHTSFQNTSSCGWGGCVSPLFKPASEFKLCTRHTHTHTTHHDILEISFDRVKSLHFSSLLLQFCGALFKCRLSLNYTTADIHVYAVYCVYALCASTKAKCLSWRTHLACKKEQQQQ